MKNGVDDLLKSTFHQGEIPTETLNQTVLQMVKESGEMRRNGLKTDGTGQGKSQKGRGYRLKNSGIRRFAAVAAVFVMVVLMGSGVVHAAKKFFGIDYFWERYGSEGMSEETKELVDDKPMVTVKESGEEPDILDFKVSSVLCDSQYVVLTLDVDVKDPDKYFLVTGVTDLNEPVSCMSLGIDSEKTVGEYCMSRGLQPVQVHTELDNPSKKFVDIVTWDNEQTDTGSGSFMICAKRLTSDKSFTMGIKTKMALGKGEKYVSSYTGDTLQVDVKDKSTEQVAYYSVGEKAEYHVPDTAVTLNKVKLTTTEVGTYSEIEYTDKSTTEESLVEYIELCDKNGDSMKSNIVGVGTCQSKGKNAYLAKGCYESVGLPDTIYVSIDDSGKAVKLRRVEQ